MNKVETVRRSGDWMMASLEVALVRVGAAMEAESRVKASGISWASWGEGRLTLAPSDSYSNTSGMLPSVGEKGSERGLAGKDMLFTGASCGDGRCLGGAEGVGVRC